MNVTTATKEANEFATEAQRTLRQTACSVLSVPRWPTCLSWRLGVVAFRLSPPSADDLPHISG